jgi:hypothetical protein
MPPLEPNDSEMSMLLTLSAPIDQRLRPQFLEVAQELEAKRQAGEIGEGSVRARFRGAFDPPQLGESKYRRA